MPKRSKYSRYSQNQTYYYRNDNGKKLVLLHVIKEANDVIKEANDVVKGKANVTKEFAKTQRQIYKLISQMPQISAAQMSENMGISLRQVQRYLKQLSDQNLIVREEERKNGVWRILDDEYEGFFKRI